MGIKQKCFLRVIGVRKFGTNNYLGQAIMARPFLIVVFDPVLYINPPPTPFFPSMLLLYTVAGRESGEGNILEFSLYHRSIS